MNHLKHAAVSSAGITAFAVLVLAQAQPPTTPPSPATTRALTEREREMEDARTKLFDLAKTSGIDPGEIKPLDRTLAFAGRTTSARLGRFLQDIQRTALRPLDLEIVSIQPGADDLDLRLRVAVDPLKDGEHKLDFVQCLRDLTASFPAGANTVWATSLRGDTSTGTWEVAGFASEIKFVEELTASLHKNANFLEVKALALHKVTQPPGAKAQFRLTFSRPRE